MIAQPTQHKSIASRSALTVVGTHTADMTGWALTAVLADTDGAEVSTKTTSDGITISTITATVDFTTESLTLDPGVYQLSIRRTDAGAEDLLAVMRLSIAERDPWTI